MSSRFTPVGPFNLAPLRENEFRLEQLRLDGFGDEEIDALADLESMLSDWHSKHFGAAQVSITPTVEEFTERGPCVMEYYTTLTATTIEIDWRRPTARHYQLSSQ